MSTQTPPIESTLPLEIQNQIVAHFISQRESLGAQLDSKTEIADSIAANLNKTLISLSGGALIFSMTFVDKIAPAKLALGLLIGAWLLFGASMIAVMLSMRAHNQFLEGGIKKASQLYALLQEKEKEALKTGRVTNVVPAAVEESKYVNILNLIAVMAFGVGVALLAGFVGYNVWHGP